MSPKKIPLASYHIVLSVVSRVRRPVCLCSVCPAQDPDSDKEVSFFFRDGLKSVDTR